MSSLSSLPSSLPSSPSPSWSSRWWFACSIYYVQVGHIHMHIISPQVSTNLTDPSLRLAWWLYSNFYHFSLKLDPEIHAFDRHPSPACPFFAVCGFWVNPILGNIWFGHLSSLKLDLLTIWTDLNLAELPLQVVGLVKKVEFSSWFFGSTEDAIKMLEKKKS